PAHLTSAHAHGSSSLELRRPSDRHPAGCPRGWSTSCQITSTRLRCSSSDRNWRDRLEECRPSRSGCVRLPQRVPEDQRDRVLLADQEVPVHPAVLEGQASRLCREAQVLRLDHYGREVPAFLGALPLLESPRQRGGRPCLQSAVVRCERSPSASCSLQLPSRPG